MKNQKHHLFHYITRGYSLFTLFPLILFIVMALLFFFQLSNDKDPGIIPSALIGKAAPLLVFEPLRGAKNVDNNSIPAFKPDILTSYNKVTVVNVWASWCLPCRQEHPFLMMLSKDPRLQIAGINYKDSNANALKFLDELKNPYDFIGIDPDGEMAIEWGVYGIPETFIVNRKGIVVHKHVGALDPVRLEKTFLPALTKAFNS